MHPFTTEEQAREHLNEVNTFLNSSDEMFMLT